MFEEIEIVCPACKAKFRVMINADGKFVMPLHGKTLGMECPTGDKTFKMVLKSHFKTKSETR